MELGSEWEWGVFWMESIRDFVITVVAFLLAYMAAMLVFQRERRIADEARQRVETYRMEDLDREVYRVTLDREHMGMALLYKLALRGRAVHERAVDLVSGEVPAGTGRETVDASDWKRLRDDFSIWQVDALTFIPEYADTEAGRLAERLMSTGCQVFWLLNQREPDQEAAGTCRDDFDRQTRVIRERLGVLSGTDLLLRQDTSAGDMDIARTHT